MQKQSLAGDLQHTANERKHQNSLEQSVFLLTVYLSSYQNQHSVFLSFYMYIDSLTYMYLLLSVLKLKCLHRPLFLKIEKFIFIYCIYSLLLFDHVM